MKLFSFLSLSLVVFCSPTWAAAPDSANITTVENGLLPANVFKGDQPWTLQERMQQNVTRSLPAP